MRLLICWLLGHDWDEWQLFNESTWCRACWRCGKTECK